VKLSVVQDLEQHGRFQEALDVIDKGDQELNIDLVLIKSRLLSVLDQQDDAFKILNNLFFETDLLQSDIDNLKFQTVKSDILLKIGRLSDAQKSIMSGKEASNKLSTQKLSVENKIWLCRFIMMQGLYLEKNWKLDEAHKLYVQALKMLKKLNDPRELSKAYYQIGSILDSKGKINQAISEYSKSLQISVKLKNKYDIASTLNYLGIAYGKKGDNDAANDYLVESMEIFESLKNQYELAKVYNNLGIINKLRGLLNNAEEYYSKALSLALIIGNKEAISNAYINIGTIQFEKGDLEEALLSYNKVISMAKEVKNKESLATIKHNMGLIYKKQGEHNSALAHFNESLEIRKEYGNQMEIASNFQNIGSIYWQKGELDAALKQFNEALLIWKSVNNEAEIAFVLQHTGLIFLEKGEEYKGYQKLKECYKIRKKIGNEIFISEILYYLIYANIKLGDPDSVSAYYKELKKIKKKTDNRTIKVRSMLAEAMILQSSSRIMQKVEAQNIFEEFLSEQLVDSELTIFALLSLCEFLILELKSSGEIEVLDEIRTILEKLYEIANEQESHTLLIDILVIQSKISMIDYDVSDTYSYLEHAYDIAEEHELNHYKVKISYLQSEVKDQVDRFRKMAAGVTLGEKLDQLEIENYIQEIARISSFNPEEGVTLRESDTKVLKSNLDFASMLLMDQNFPEDMRRYVYFLTLSTKEIQLLVSTYILLDKISAIDYLPNDNEFDLGELIEERLILQNDRLKQKELDVLIDKPEYLVMLKSDRYLLLRVFDNLIQNAIKFTPKMGSLEAKIMDDDEQWIISIKNDSPVIPKEDLLYLFDKYRQYPHNPYTIKTGVGIGLSFVKRAIEVLGGDVTLQSPAMNKENGFGVEIKIKKNLD